MVSAAATGTQVVTTDLEAEHPKINGDGLKLGQHVSVDNILKAVNVVNRI
jgi:hypothetical protein